MNKTICEYTQQNLSSFYDGELSSPDATALRSHVAKCRECSAELRSFANLADELSLAVPAVFATPSWIDVEKQLSHLDRSATFSPRLRSRLNAGVV